MINYHQPGVPASTQIKECQRQLKMTAWKWNCEMWSIDFRRRKKKKKKMGAKQAIFMQSGSKWSVNFIYTSTKAKLTRYAQNIHSISNQQQERLSYSLRHRINNCNWHLKDKNSIFKVSQQKHHCWEWQIFTTNTQTNCLLMHLLKISSKSVHTLSTATHANWLT